MDEVENQDLSTASAKAAVAEGDAEVSQQSTGESIWSS
jgi:hypothetical protein